MAIDRQSALAAAAARVSAVEDRQVFGFEVRGPFEDHRAAAEASGGLNLGSGDAERRQQIEGGIIKRAQRNPQAFNAEFFPSVHLLNANLTSKAASAA